MLKGPKLDGQFLGSLGAKGMRFIYCSAKVRVSIRPLITADMPVDIGARVGFPTVESGTPKQMCRNTFTARQRV